jgi:hypothetical protein
LTLDVVGARIYFKGMYYSYHRSPNDFVGLPYRQDSPVKPARAIILLCYASRFPAGSCSRQASFSGARHNCRTA